ncbi:hypothetical protein GCM10010492_45300 [Saccharothrix mutabilis subsp. mutabilis]|uniref:Uncharacterized protein n=1 Tax=Saccharothrix mutabilis subsp. mutabilis TaxID=66855 RepID=A0ABN0U7E6_9PSEU
MAGMARGGAGGVGRRGRCGAAREVWGGAGGVAGKTPGVAGGRRGGRQALVASAGRSGGAAQGCVEAMARRWEAGRVRGWGEGVGERSGLVGAPWRAPTSFGRGISGRSGE